LKAAFDFEGRLAPVTSRSGDTGGHRRSVGQSFGQVDAVALGHLLPEWSE
jgi:hypothetical protein